MAPNPKPSQRLPLAVDATAVDLGTLKTKDDSPFRYFIEGERPRADGAFFELLLSRVFLEQGKVGSFDEIWPRAVQALAGLNLYRLSQMSPEELGAAIEAAGGEFASRLGTRAGALQTWADAFWRIRQIYGSFRQYVRSFDSDGHDALVADLRQRLVGLSPDFLEKFLRESGEKPASAQHAQQPEPARGQQQQRKPKHAPGQQSRPNADGNRRNQPRNNAEGKPATPPAPPAKAKDGDDSKTAPRSRRGRRGFFRRRRGGGRGDRPQGQPAAATTPNQT